MNRNMWKLLTGLCVLAISAFCAAPANAQMSPVKEKTPNYSYVSNWQLPRTQWSAVDKSNADDTKLLEKAVAE